MVTFLGFLSGLFGWIYTLAWSASFYPQPLLNWQRQTTSGSTVDYPFLNVVGFTAYLTSNVAFYYSPTVRAQYAARHHDLTPTVAFNDITFALHALILSILTTSQYLQRSLWGFPSHPGNRPSRPILGVTTGCIIGVFTTYYLAATGGGAAADPASTFDPTRDWCALDVVYAIGYVKLIVTLIKYIPQIIANWRNRSTKGWSIWQILLDLTGGVFSVSQQGVDSWVQGDWSGITGNPVKFALGNLALFYDTIFIVQHYVLYRDRGDKAKDGDATEEDRLLGDEERRVD